MTAQDGTEYRATHYDDPVPRLPPIILGYYHTSAEYWLASGPADNINYTLGDIAVCTGYANTTCNAGSFGLDVDAHSYYFQYLDCNITASHESTLRRRRSNSSSDVTDEELAATLTNYTRQDIRYSQQLKELGQAQWV